MFDRPLRVCAAFILLVCSPARAVTTTWSGLGDQWSSATSWTNGVPVNGRTLLFSAQGAANPVSYYSLDLTVPSLTFAANAPSYTIHVGLQKYLVFNGTGITNLSGVRQTIINEGEYNSGTFFENAASAGDTYIENHNVGVTGFYNTSTAGTSHIDNYVTGDFSNTYTQFWDTSTAGSSTIVNHLSPTNASARGFVDFAEKSSAGSSTLINDGGGVVSFGGTATAANSTIIGTGATGSIASLLYFGESSTAGSATVNFTGGKIWFDGTSKSASSNITAHNGTEIVFESGAVISNATSFTVNGTSNLYLSNLTNPTVGSLAGNGRIEWSTGSTLTVGNLNRDTTVSGIFTGGNLTKQGTGILTLNPTQTYSGNTTVTAGALAISQWSALGAGSLILTSGGTLRYTGATASTGRVIQFGSTASAGSGVIDASGSGTLTVSNAAVAYGTTNQTRTIILGGTNTSDNIFAPSISTNGTSAVSLQKTGTGTWKLTGTNTNTGTTSVFGGTLKLGAARTTAAPVVVNATAAEGTSTFALDGVDATISTLTFGGATAGGSSTNTVATGANTLTISGTSAITYTATNNPGAALISGKLDLGTGNHSFAIGNSTAAANDLVVSAAVSGSGTLTKTGLGTLVFSGANTMSGTIAISGGTLKLGSSTAIRAAGNAVTLNTLAIGADTTFDLANYNASVTGLTFGGSSAIAGSTNSVTTGTGTLTLVGTGSITTSASNNPSSASISGKLNLGDTARSFTIADSTGAASDLTISAVISGNSAIGFTKSGAGVLTLSADNTYSGSTTITAGTLSVASFASLGTATSTALAPNLILSGGTLRYTGATTSLSRYIQIGLTAAGGSGTIDASGTGALTIASTSGLVYGTNNQTRTVILGGSNTGANTFAAALANNGSGATSLQKTGLGAWTISRANSFTGGTTITNGTLVLNASAALGTGGVSITGGTLMIASGVAITNAVTLSGGSYDRAITASTSFANLINATSNFAGGASNTTASLLGGQASATTTLHSSFKETSTATNDIIRLSDVYTLDDIPVVNITTGQTDTFVLQLAVSTVLADSYLGWLDTESNSWVNAVDGNFGGINLYAGDRAYNPATDFQLGTWGVDSNTKTVWAVLNHNSDYAVVPEPTTFLLLTLAAALLFRRPYTR